MERSPNKWFPWGEELSDLEDDSDESCMFDNSKRCPLQYSTMLQDYITAICLVKPLSHWKEIMNCVENCSLAKDAFEDLIMVLPRLLQDMQETSSELDLSKQPPGTND